MRFHIPQGWALILGLVAIVLTLRFRHVVQDFYERERGTVFYALSSIYIVFLGIAVFIEFTLQPGKNVLDVLEETLEMNASFVWMLLALTVRDFCPAASASKAVPLRYCSLNSPIVTVVYLS